jgi:ABC-type branched-subunit amino acid transport system substrate-binding protein
MTGKGFAMKTPGIRTVLALLFLIIATGLVSRSPLRAAGNETTAPGNGPVRIGVCLPSGGPGTETAKVQAEGVRMACDMEKARPGIRAELVFRETGASPADVSRTLQRLIDEDRVSGIISCVPAEVLLKAVGMARQRPLPMVSTTTARPDPKSKDRPSIVMMGTSLEEQAQACSRFAAEVLHARRIGLIVDVQDENGVRLASLFSSDVVKRGGSITDIAYVKKGEDPAKGIAHLMKEKPDTVYVPFSGSSSPSAVAKARSFDMARPFLTSNMRPEESFISDVDKSFEGLYIQSDFVEETVRSPRGKEFIAYYHKHTPRGAYLGSSTAAGADAYFLVMDMIARQQAGGSTEPQARGTSWKPFLLGMTLEAPGTEAKKHLLFGRIKKDFFARAALKYIASIAVDRSDTLADVRAQ